MHQNAHLIRIYGMEGKKTLEQAICTRIAAYEAQRARRAFIASAVFLPVSGVAFFVSLWYAAGAFAQSGFVDYVSLILSDTDTVLSYWGDFAYSVVEAIPFGAVTASLGLLVLVLVTLRFIISFLHHESIRSSSPRMV